MHKEKKALDALPVSIHDGEDTLRHRPPPGWTVEHTAYPPLKADCNLETLLIRCPKEYADGAVCYEGFYDRKDNVLQSNHRKTPVLMLDTLDRSTKEV